MECLLGRPMYITIGEIFVNSQILIVRILYLSHFSPCGKKFRSKPQIARFLGETADLTCFDFSRAGTLGDGTQRRRARDRNPQGSGRRLDPHASIMSPSVRPLSMNPLRPSGPIRRTCGVIKLPVMLLSPPAGDTPLRDSILGQQGINDQKSHSLNVVVQSQWERRLQTINPHDHITGKEVTRKDMQQSSIPLTSIPLSRPDSSISIASSLTQSQKPVLPGLVSSQPQLPGGSTLQTLYPRSTPPQTGHVSNRIIHNSPSSNTPLTGTKLLQVHQLKNLSTTSSSSSISPQIPHTVTDTDVRIQEQRVQLLRQQLMAAQSGL